MGAVLETIVNFIYSIGMVLANFLDGLWQMITMIPKAVTFLTMAMGHMPGIVSVFIYALVMINIVYLILGR